MKINLFKIIIPLIIVLIFFSSCEEENLPDEKNYKIINITPVQEGAVTIKLKITFDRDIPNLCADDILINSSFVLIKKELTKIDSCVYELGIKPGGQGRISMGLNPYRGFTGWEAKTVNVYTDFEFYFIDDKRLSITGYNLSVAGIIIPEKIEGIPVTSIGNSAFYHKSLKNAVIPDSVTQIGDSAFAYNNLESIEIPENVVRIGNYAFAGNKLTEITIPDSVKQAGTGAFRDNKITTAVISENITVIEAQLFMRNELTDITIPDNVTLIKREAFFENKLSIIDLGIGVEEVETFAFWGNNFSEITIGSDVKLGIASFGERFETFYNINKDKEGGTYIFISP